MNDHIEDHGMAQATKEVDACAAPKNPMGEVPEVKLAGTVQDADF